ncbi:MAG: hypoxanthine phosphoribosyltransferase [Actinomycetota bacterium]|nr:hypoxanthine phosphoribosyltransferase [Actinomycetota bacterium]
MTATPAPAEVLITRAQLSRRIDELGHEIGDSLAASPGPPLLVSVLKGATMFLADLFRAIPCDVAVDFMSISSYGSGQTGVVRILKDLDTSVTGRDVLIVEDIVDTGLTLNYLRRTLSQRAPRSVTTVTLLDKVARRIVPVDVEYRGFEIPDVFVVGYGLDFQGLYRNLPCILAVQDLAKLANRPALLAEGLFDGGGGPEGSSTFVEGC